MIDDCPTCNFSKVQYFAWRWILREGHCYSGVNTYKGKNYTILKSTLRSLERRGLVTLKPLGSRLKASKK